VIASAETAAAVGEIVIDACRLEGRLRIAEQIGDRFRRFVRRLHAHNKFEVLAVRVIPGKAAFRFEKHWID
jgi:hypothetical protein